MNGNLQQIAAGEEQDEEEEEKEARYYCNQPQKRRALCQLLMNATVAFEQFKTPTQQRT